MDWTTTSRVQLSGAYDTPTEANSVIFSRELTLNTFLLNATNMTASYEEIKPLIEVSTIHSSTINAPTEPVDDAAAKLIATMNGLIIPVLYFILFFFGFLGNAVVVYVSCCLRRRNRTAVDIYVGNLAIADIALITTLPFWAVTNMLNGVWKFKDSGCKIMSFLTHLNMYSSILFITAMAVDRYTVVVKPIKVRAKSLRSTRRTLITCVITWFISVLLALPAAIMRMEKYYTPTSDKIVCSWVYPENTEKIWWALHIFTRQIIGFVIPLAIICRCYCVIVSYISNRASIINQRTKTDGDSGEEQKSKQQKHVTRLVTVIILAFVVCWLPNQISNFYHSLVHFNALPRPTPGKPAEIVYLVHIFSTVLSFCNSVINPVIYSTSPCHRAQIKMLFFRVFRCFRKIERDSYTAYLSQKEDVDSTRGRRRKETECTRLPIDFQRSSPSTQNAHKSMISVDTNVNLLSQTGGGVSPQLKRIKGEDIQAKASNDSIELTSQAPRILVEHYGREKETSPSL